MAAGTGAESLIDLGVDFGPREPDDSWVPTRRALRRLRPAVPILAVLLLARAAVAAPADPLRRVARNVPVNIDASVMVAGGDLYVYDVDGLHAYRLDGGAPLWSAPMTEVPTETAMSYRDGLLLVSMDATDDARAEHTVAFDGVTGHRLWASDLGFAEAVSGGVLLSSAPPPPGYNFVGTNLTETFQLLDARTGTARWSLEFDPDCLTSVVSAVGGPADTLVVLCASTRELTEYGLADGLVRARRSVDLGDPGSNFLLPAADRLPVPQLAVVGDTIAVAHAHAPVPAVDGYALGPLDRRWSGSLIMAGQTLRPCGARLCLVDASGGGPVVDPATGTRTGTLPDATGPADGSLVLVPQRGGTVTPVPTVGAGASVVLPAGGTVGVDLRLPLNRPPGLSVVTPGTGTPGASAWLARWTGGGPLLIGSLPGAGAGSCAAAGGYLICATSGGITVWQR